MGVRDRDEATKKRGGEDEIDEENTAKFLRKLDKKERTQKRKEKVTKKMHVRMRSEKRWTASAK